MPEILFVHGTGVRLEAYDKAVAHLEWKAGRVLNGAKVRRCYWGDEHGAQLGRNGLSVPDYGAAAQQDTSEWEEAARWRLLYDDPLFEIRLLRPHVLPTSGPVPQGVQSLKLLRSLDPGEDFLQLLKESGLDAYWPAAYQEISESQKLEEVLKATNRKPPEISQALARALMARVTALGIAAGGSSAPIAARDRMIQILQAKLGGIPLGIFDWIKDPIVGLGKRYATSKAERERRALTDAAYPAAGDILKYQMRGEHVRTFIRERIEECKGDVIVVAHSLGGIACVDLLASKDLGSRVKGLVTVGSQAPFLYEIDALFSLRCTYEVQQPLPGHFPRWLNLYDPHDLLSYKAAPVFQDGADITDQLVESKETFPESHSAYWNQDITWSSIRGHFAW